MYKHLSRYDRGAIRDWIRDLNKDARCDLYCQTFLHRVFKSTVVRPAMKKSFVNHGSDESKAQFKIALGLTDEWILMKIVHEELIEVLRGEVHGKERPIKGRK